MLRQGGTLLFSELRCSALCPVFRPFLCIMPITWPPHRSPVKITLFEKLMRIKASGETCIIRWQDVQSAQHDQPMDDFSDRQALPQRSSTRTCWLKA